MIKILSKEEMTEKMKKRIKALEEVRGRAGDPDEDCQYGRCLSWCTIYCGSSNNTEAMLNGNIAYR